MVEQTYANHKRYVTGYHFVLLGLVLLYSIGSVWYTTKTILAHSGRLLGLLVLISAAIVFLLSWYIRVFALKAQDRAIRAEENLRHFILTGKPLSPALTLKQIIALRFASDDEFVALSVRAVTENLSSDAIKREIKNWRADHDRV